MAPAKVVLAGANGHGRHHLGILRDLTARGLVELAGVCDLRPAEVDFCTPLQSPDLGELIAKTGAEFTIICTPINTHADLAITALRGGSHVLLEKPPAPSIEEQRRIAEVVAETGLACQVGFQSLGSAAVPALRRLIAGGSLGRVRGIGGSGAWERPSAYFTRAPWSGRRRLNGVDVMDGALTNPFAHATATALALVDAPPHRRDRDRALPRPPHRVRRHLLRTDPAGGRARDHHRGHAVRARVGATARALPGGAR
ncbi:Gfo/Idh/MocA family oxidoreductase [Nonomuraea salmonea]|uniref:Gfo/Idh/MocA family protein n=1 Tax=Nonomuraea salmonea TaxID=46181 RepID=UPI002FE81D8B